MPATAATPGDAELPNTLDYPEQDFLQNRPLEGRPKLEAFQTIWPEHLPKESTNAMPLAQIMKRGFQNQTGVCYRNTALQMLVNLAPLYHFLEAHATIKCAIQDCLHCSFREVFVAYHTAGHMDPIIDVVIELELARFWNLCQKVFYGPNSQRERKIAGNGDPNTVGGEPGDLMSWLIWEMRQQLASVPAQWQLFDRLFFKQMTIVDHCDDQACHHEDPAVHKEMCFTRICLQLTPDPFDVQSALLAEKQTLKRQRPCPRCQMSSVINRSTLNINLPEILIVYLQRYRGEGEFVDTPIQEHIEVPTTGRRESYSLQSIAVQTMGSLLQQPPGGMHVFAGIRGRSGYLTVLNDMKRHYLSSWDVLDQLQRHPQPMEDLLMPDVLIYTRDHPAVKTTQDRTLLIHPREDPSKYPRPISDSFAKMIRDNKLIFDKPTNEVIRVMKEIKTALPKISENDILRVYLQNSGDLNGIMRELIFDPSPIPWVEDDLNAVSIFNRANVLKLHAEFPMVQIHKINELLRQQLANKRGNYVGVREYLLSYASIETRFVQNIGDQASVKVSVNAVPVTLNTADGTGPLDFQEQNVSGEYMYQHGNKTWWCEFFAKAKPLEPGRELRH